MKKLPVPTVMLPTAEIVVPTVSAPFTAIVLAVMMLAVERILVHELVALEYWYDTWFTTVTCPFVGDTGKAIISPVGLIHYLCRIRLFNSWHFYTNLLCLLALQAILHGSIFEVDPDFFAVLATVLESLFDYFLQMLALATTLLWSWYESL